MKNETKRKAGCERGAEHNDRGRREMKGETKEERKETEVRACVSAGGFFSLCCKCVDGLEGGRWAGWALVFDDRVRDENE